VGSALVREAGRTQSLEVFNRIGTEFATVRISKSGTGNWKILIDDAESPVLIDFAKGLIEAMTCLHQHVIVVSRKLKLD